MEEKNEVLSKLSGEPELPLICTVSFDINFRVVEWNGGWKQLLAENLEVGADLRKLLPFLYGTENLILDIHTEVKSSWTLPYVEFCGSHFQVQLVKYRSLMNLILVPDFGRAGSKGEVVHSVGEEKGEKENSLEKSQKFLRYFNHDLQNVLQIMVCFIELEKDLASQKNPMVNELTKSVKKVRSLLEVSSEYSRTLVDKRSHHFVKVPLKSMALQIVLDFKKKKIIGNSFEYKILEDSLSVGILNRDETLSAIAALASLLCREGVRIDSVGFGVNDKSFVIQFFCANLSDPEIERVVQMLDGDIEARVTDVHELYLSYSFERLNIRVYKEKNMLSIVLGDSALSH